MDVGYEEVYSIRPGAKKLNQVDVRFAFEFGLAVVVSGHRATADEKGSDNRRDISWPNGNSQFVLVAGKTRTSEIRLPVSLRARTQTLASPTCPPAGRVTGVAASRTRKQPLNRGEVA